MDASPAMSPTVAQLGGMFTAPLLAGAGLAAVSVPIAIHLLWRLRRRPRAWGAMRFLEAAYRRHRQRMRFEQLLLLLVRCLILAVLGFALAGPMLSGAAAQWVTGLDAGGRVVHIVIDDALASRAVDAADERRFDRLRERALAVVDALGPGDSAALWRSARPAEAVIAEPTEDRAALREAIGDLSPRYSRPDAVTALRQVESSLSELGVPEERAKVIVLDSFSESARHLDEPPPTALRDLGERAALWASPPAPDAANVQIERLSPHRRMLLAAGGRVEVPVRLELRRFDRDLAAAEAPLSVSLRRADGRVLANAQRTHRFAAGERSGTLNVSLTSSEAEADLDGGARMLVLEARLDAEGLDNQLAADDRRLAVVELRSHLDVALIDELSVEGESADGLRPAQWLTLALDPDEDGTTSGVRLAQMNPGEVSSDQLRDLDAALVLRPDLLSSEAWDRLAEFTDAGGLLWVFTPPLETPATWSRELIERFELEGWRVGLEPIASADDRGVPLDAEVSVPDPLALLAADFEALARPVRLMRRLPMDVPEPALWLRTRPEAGAAQAQGQGDSVEGSAILAGEPFGAGAVLLQSTALHTDWTNLPTKPLFVPLKHESLRGVLGAARDRIEPEVVVGDAPSFGSAWTDMTRLERSNANEAQGQQGQQGQDQDDDDAASIALRGAEDGRGVHTARPVQRPGIYTAAGAPGALKLAVNVDADAGDTRGVTEQRVLSWLNELGGGELLDEHDRGLAAMFARDAAVVNIGWTLLWLVLALVILETLLSRYVSHAHHPGRRGIGGRMVEAMRYLRHGRAHAAHAETAQGGRAA